MYIYYIVRLDTLWKQLWLELPDDLSMAERNGIVNDFNRNTNEIGFLMDREATGFHERGMQLIVVEPPRCMHSLLAKTTKYNEGGRHEQRRQSRIRGPVLMRGSMRRTMGNAGRLIFDKLRIVVGGRSRSRRGTYANYKLSR